MADRERPNFKRFVAIGWGGSSDFDDLQEALRWAEEEAACYDGFLGEDLKPEIPVLSVKEQYWIGPDGECRDRAPSPKGREERENMKWDEMTARERDAAVSEHIFGRRWREYDRVCINGSWRKGETWLPEAYSPEHPPAGGHVGMVPRPYSTDIACAWEVVEKMHEGDEQQLEDFHDQLLVWRYGMSGESKPLTALTAEEASGRICLAALRAKGVEV